MMATHAFHQLGDISRDQPDLALITGEDEHDWIGQWVEGLGYIDVRFPKGTTRPLTADEAERFNGRVIAEGVGAWQIRIGEPEIKPTDVGICCIGYAPCEGRPGCEADRG